MYLKLLYTGEDLELSIRNTYLLPTYLGACNVPLRDRASRTNLLEY